MKKIKKFLAAGISVGMVFLHAGAVLAQSNGGAPVDQGSGQPVDTTQTQADQSQVDQSQTDQSQQDQSQTQTDVSGSTGDSFDAAVIQGQQDLASDPTLQTTQAAIIDGEDQAAASVSADDTNPDIAPVEVPTFDSNLSADQAISSFNFGQPITDQISPDAGIITSSEVDSTVAAPGQDTGDITPAEQTILDNQAQIQVQEDQNAPQDQSQIDQSQPNDQDQQQPTIDQGDSSDNFGSADQNQSPTDNSGFDQSQSSDNTSGQ